MGRSEGAVRTSFGDLRKVATVGYAHRLSPHYTGTTTTISLGRFSGAAPPLRRNLVMAVPMGGNVVRPLELDGVCYLSLLFRLRDARSERLFRDACGNGNGAARGWDGR